MLTGSGNGRAILWDAAGSASPSTMEPSSLPPTTITLEIPGGVVASNGKDVLYYDFRTKKRTNLTSDIKDVVVSGSFAISENGKTLVWVQDNKMWSTLPCSPRFLKQLRLGNKKYILQCGLFLLDKSPKEIVKHYGLIDYTIPPKQKIRNLSLSPKGWQLSYELDQEDTALVQVPPGSKLDKQWLKKASYPTLREPYMKYPLYEQQKDTYQAIHAVTIDGIMIEDDVCFGTLGFIAWCRLGNTASCPPTIPYRYMDEDWEKVRPPATPGEILPIQTTWKSWPSTFHQVGFGQIGLIPTEAAKRFSIKRNACFGTWSKDSKLFALIYQTSMGWGPIEIHDPAQPRIFGVDYKKRIKPGMKAGVYEISILLKSCDGLAFKPDGSLTYLSEGKVFSLDGTEIKKGIDGSSIIANPDPEYYGPIPANNVFSIAGAPVAEDVYGSRICWMSDHAFIFRNKEAHCISGTRANQRNFSMDCQNNFSIAVLFLT